MKLSETLTMPILTPPENDCSLLTYVKKHHHDIRHHVTNSGCLLIRGLSLKSKQELGELNTFLYGNTLQYLGGISYRENTRSTVFEASQIPKALVVPQHREMAYLPSHHAADRVSFYCHVPATTGGQTPITDFESVYEEILQLKPTTMSELLSEGLIINTLYWNRDFWKAKGISMWGWQDSFDCQHQADMDLIAKSLGVHTIHKEAYSLITAKLPIATTHPLRRSQVMYPFLYYNQRTMLEHYDFPDEMANFFKYMLSACDDNEFNAFRQSGQILDKSFIDAYHTAVCNHTYSFEWQAGDCLLLDNNWVGHGRRPYSGDERDHWVCLSTIDD